MENTIIFGKTKCAKKFTGKENQILVIDDFENSISAVVMFFFTKFEREIESFLYDENATPEKLAEKILEIFKTLFLCNVKIYRYPIQHIVTCCYYNKLIHFLTFISLLNSVM